MSQLRFALIAVVAACGGASSPPSEKPQPTSGSAADITPLCTQIFARKATCADDYLPALLDLRVELNLPPGIGDEVKTQGRDAVLATARGELARDTQPAQVAAVCDAGAAKAQHAPPERVTQLVGQARQCEAAGDCKSFATCATALDRVFIAGGPH